MNTAVNIDLCRLLSIAEDAAQPLLEAYWSDEVIEQFGRSKKKAFKLTPEKEVGVIRSGMLLYLPSRIKRCITEWVGRTIRSQYIRKHCFEDVRVVVAVTGLEESINILIRKVHWTLRHLYGKYYKWTMLRQTLRMLRRLVLHDGLDIWMLSYTNLVRPQLQHVVFPYGRDDSITNGQAICFELKGNTIHVEIKAPVNDLPMGEKDWEWIEEEIALPQKLQQRIAQAKTPQPQRPDLRLLHLKGGLEVPVLQFGWEYARQTLNVAIFEKQRVLAVDTGLVNLLTSVVCQAGSQITPPIFFKNKMFPLSKVKYMYDLIAIIQRKLSRLPINTRGQNRRRKELSRLHAKLTRLRSELTYALIKELLRQAKLYRCETIVLEDLGAYIPPTGKHGLSRDLNNWAHGELFKQLKRKAGMLGITVEAIPPYGTSSYCPRCGHKGRKVRCPTSYKENKKGRHFWCPYCHYRADRDYIGALNIYRVFQLPKNQRYHIKQAMPVFYMKTEVSCPHNRPGGTAATDEHPVIPAVQ